MSTHKRAAVQVSLKDCDGREVETLVYDVSDRRSFYEVAHVSSRFIGSILSAVQGFTVEGLQGSLCVTEGCHGFVPRSQGSDYCDDCLEADGP